MRFLKTKQTNPHIFYFDGPYLHSLKLFVKNLCFQYMAIYFQMFVNFEGFNHEHDDLYMRPF